MPVEILIGVMSTIAVVAVYFWYLRSKRGDSQKPQEAPPQGTASANR
jgi:hypothetical protein